MQFNWQGYKTAIENEFTIVDKNGKEVNFVFNYPQDDFIKEITGKDLVLKARQEGFSSEILAIGSIKFIFGENERCVSISNETTATQRLLDRVKYFIQSFEKKNGIEIPKKYNNKNELVYDEKHNTFYIGTAGSRDFGRGDTITFLHLSEFFFYPDPEKTLAGIMQAVTPNGLVFIESTANGFNFGKEFWDRTKLNETGFKAHFYGPEWIYTKEVLDQKKRELGRLYDQEYPETAEQAFLTSGSLYFDSFALQWYLNNTKDVINSDLVYV